MTYSQKDAEIERIREINEELVTALENLLAVSPWSSAEVRNAAYAAILKATE